MGDIGGGPYLANQTPILGTRHMCVTILMPLIRFRGGLGRGVMGTARFGWEAQQIWCKCGAIVGCGVFQQGDGVSH